MGDVYTESNIVKGVGNGYVFAVTVTYDLETGDIVNTDYEAVLKAGEDE